MAACLALAEKAMPHLRLVHGGNPVFNMFRADGMRVWRRSTQGSTILVTRSDYDGQMPVLEQQTQSGSLVWRRWNALGARGVDAFYNSTSSSWHYPIYDVHGNVKATLTRSGGTSFATANWKQYDVWGGERSSTGSGSMFGYCGNLGHPTDPENGLIYMRARFYEPWTGRFLSEDPALDGSNSYIYAYNAPPSYADADGKDAEWIVRVMLQVFLFFVSQILMGNLEVAASRIYELERNIKHLEAGLKGGLTMMGDADGLAKMRTQLEGYKKLLQRAKYYKGGQATLKYLGYALLVKVFLLDIDFGSDTSGLDLLYNKFYQE